MPIECRSAVCDVHQSFVLRPCTVTFRAEHRLNDEDALCCPSEGCHRCYSPWRGYFSAVAGEHLNQGVPRFKPQCRHNSEPLYMFLAKTDGEPIWKCPDENCQTTRPLLSDEAKEVLRRMERGLVLVGSISDFDRPFRPEHNDTWDDVSLSITNELLQAHRIGATHDRGNSQREFRPVV